MVSSIVVFLQQVFGIPLFQRRTYLLMLKKLKKTGIIDFFQMVKEWYILPHHYNNPKSSLTAFWILNVHYDAFCYRNYNRHYSSYSYGTFRQILTLCFLYFIVSKVMPRILVSGILCISSCET